MADATTVAIVIAGASLAVTVVREIITATRTHTRETEGAKALVASELAKLREEFRMEHDQELRRNGEVAAALRTKIGEVELWTRDNTVRIPHFSETIAGINRNIELLGARMDASLERIEQKLDKQLERR
jgi:hypothetical protein